VAKRKAKVSDLERIRRGLPVMGAVAGSVVLVVGLAILPTRTWLSQRSSGADAQARLERMEAEIVQLEHRLELLSTDAEIERLARKNFDMVYPGEESYRILPAPASN